MMLRELVLPMVIRLFRIWLLNREIERGLKRQRIIRKARSEASLRGISTYWKRAGDRAREMVRHG